MGNCFSNSCTNLCTSNKKSGKYLKGFDLNPHVMFLGPKGAGKTTLMYNTLFPDEPMIWELVEPTVGFHFEELKRKKKLSIGFWDISGDSAIQDIWSMFYKMFQVKLIIFVISIHELDSASMISNRRHLTYLSSHPALQGSRILVVMNTFNQPFEQSEIFVERILAEMNTQFLDMFSTGHVNFCLVNAIKGLGDQVWNETYTKIIDNL